MCWAVITQSSALYIWLSLEVHSLSKTMSFLYLIFVLAFYVVSYAKPAAQMLVFGSTFAVWMLVSWTTKKRLCGVNAIQKFWWCKNNLAFRTVDLISHTSIGLHYSQRITRLRCNCCYHLTSKSNIPMLEQIFESLCNLKSDQKPTLEYVKVRNFSFCGVWCR